MSLPPTSFATCVRLMFYRRSILDKEALLDKTFLVVQSAIMESNCLSDTELTLSATTANKSRDAWTGTFFLNSDEETVSIKIAQLYLITSSI